MRGLIGGGDFGLDLPADDLPVWGRGDEVLEAPGEVTLVTGPTGVGKTTLALRRTRARAGLDEAKLLGYPIAPAAGRIVYIAADRPRQIQRAWARMLREEERELLNERVLFHRGPLPFAATELERLASWALDLGARDLVIDSLKDVFRGIAKPEGSEAAQVSFQHLAAAEIQTLALHHHRKAGPENRTPRSIDDVYGGQQITAAAGSVLLLWGAPGDPIVDLLHLKQPAAEVGPFRVLHDARAGTISVDVGSDLLQIVRAAQRGLTAQEAARALYQADAPTRAQIAKGHRKLEGLAARGLVVRQPGEAIRGAVKSPDRWYAAAPEMPGSDEHDSRARGLFA